jgi:Ser/Thr protein kinase RdoA (MazF antagonist)
LRARAQPQSLLAAAQERVAAVVPADRTGFVHGDLWSGNTLWRGAELAAVIDWDCAGLGAAGVDLGSLRCDAAMCYGLDASDHVLAGWQREAERPAESLACWDAVAALSTPPDIDWFAEAIAGMTGRPDLTEQLLRERRDAFSPTHWSVFADPAEHESSRGGGSTRVLRERPAPLAVGCGDCHGTWHHRGSWLKHPGGVEQCTT